MKLPFLLLPGLIISLSPFISFENTTTVTCDTPSAECAPRLVSDIISISGEAEVWSVDFHAGSEDCFDIFDYKIALVIDSNQNNQIDSFELSLPDSLFKESLTFNCDLLGENYVQLKVSDSNGNFDKCTSILEVKDAMDVCIADIYKISGCAKTESGELISDVEFAITPERGDFLLPNDTVCYHFQPRVPLRPSIKIIPTKSDSVLSGVTTLDMMVIAEHILNRKKIDSPYKLIAADVNNSGTVTVLDLVAIRKVILNRQNFFPNNTAWRFIPESFDFPNPQNPWETTFPEHEEVFETTRNGWFDIINFVGIKVGDVI